MKITKAQLSSIIKEELLKEEEVSVEKPVPTQDATKTAEQSEKAKVVAALIHHYSLALANLKRTKPNEQTNREAKLRVEDMIKKGYSPERVWSVITQMIAHAFVSFHPKR